MHAEKEQVNNETKNQKVMVRNKDHAKTRKGRMDDTLHWKSNSTVATHRSKKIPDFSLTFH